MLDYGCFSDVNRINLLQMESFPHEPLQPRLVEDVVGEFFVREHGEGGAFGPRRQF